MVADTQQSSAHAAHFNSAVYTTPRQRSIWKSVQEAKLRGLSLRAIARELGIHRETAKRYALADSPPVRHTTIAARTQQPDCVPAA